MKLLRKTLDSPYFIAGFFLLIFYLSVIPLRDFDIWFHIKSGEIIAKMGIIHYDVFSHSAAGREWFPYEWLFQVGVYFIQQVFGFESIKYFIAVLITLLTATLFYILKRFFTLSNTLSAFLTFIFYTSVYEFFSARPHIPAYTLLLATLYLIFLYYFRGKNLLFLLIPIVYIWSNFHGSMFLSVALLGAYAVVSLVNYFLDRKEEWLKKFRTFSLYTVLSGILTVLPPLGLTQYRLLIIFFRDQKFISSFIDEWTPLSANPVGFGIITGTVILVFLLLVITAVKFKSGKEALFLLPLVPFIFLTYSASRNIFLGYITITIILGWIFSKWQTHRFSNKVYFLLTVLMIVILGFHMYLLGIKRYQPRFYYPVDAAKFIRANLNGNMFNEYGYGGYLLYALYPKQKVFIDGRTDVYLCCEIRDVAEMSLRKYQPDDSYRKFLNTVWDKYKISFVLLSTPKHSVIRRIAHILSNDSGWSLVYWDDFSQIFVRKDGKNDAVLSQYGTTAATPYEASPYRTGMESEALTEFNRMENLVDSAKSRNAIGYIDEKNGDLAGAKNEFEKAMALDPQFESPYMNLAEIKAHGGNYLQAISLYEAAKNLAPDRGLIYIRLGELYLGILKDPAKARAVWTEGAKNTSDESAKATLEKLLNQ